MKLFPCSVVALIAVSGCSSTDPEATPSPDAGGSQAPANTCPAPTGAGTEVTTSIATSTTWTAAGSPYTVDFDLGIAEGATLTLEPCTVVRMGAGRNVNVSGVLVGAGVEGSLATIEPLEEGKPWGWIDASAQTKLAVDLSYTVLRGGGTSAGAGQASLRVRGAPNDEPKAELVRVRHAVISGSASVGAQIYEGAAFTADSVDLTITGSGSRPLVLDGNGLTNLPTGSYTGNGVDRIDLSTWQTNLGGKPGQDVDVVMHDRGVPYVVGSDEDGAVELNVGSSREGAGRTRLTIEPGVTLRFRQAGILRMQGPARDEPAAGSLIAVGTAAAPIVFTSDAATPAAGDWRGVWLEAGVPSGMKIDHARIEYAGGESTTRGFSCGVPNGADVDIQNRGALVVRSDQDVTASFVTNTTFAHSAASGVDRAWSGTATDFTAGNTFEDIAFCTQTENKSSEDTCPATPACPKAE